MDAENRSLTKVSWCVQMLQDPQGLCKICHEICSISAGSHIPTISMSPKNYAKNIFPQWHHKLPLLSSQKATDPGIAFPQLSFSLGSWNKTLFHASSRHVLKSVGCLDGMLVEWHSKNFVH